MSEDQAYDPTRAPRAVGTMLERVETRELLRRQLRHRVFRMAADVVAITGLLWLMRRTGGAL